MTSIEIASRLTERVRPPLLVRLIPKQLFTGSLGLDARLYVCVGDYEELQGLTVAEAASRLYGRKREDERYRGYANHHWRLAWHHEPPLQEPHMREAYEAEQYFVVTVRPDEEDSIDLFPGTWKAIAYIATDMRRMSPRSDIVQRLLRLHDGELPFDSADKLHVDYYEYTAPDEDEFTSNGQSRYYSYLTVDSSLGHQMLEPFGVYNRCWHGRGYIGAYGELFGRVFLTRNLPLSHPQIASCELLGRDSTLKRLV